MKHYLYRHIRLDKNEPFYIGIGTKSNRNHPNIKSEYRRAFSKERKGSLIWNHIVNKTDYEVEILIESDNYEFIKEKEKEFIKLYGRINNETGILANMTDGGDGVLGYKVSKETREKMSKIAKGRKLSEETIVKIVEARKGYKHSEETKRKISNKKLGKSLSKEHKDKLFKGRDKHTNKPILQYDLEGNFIREWESATIASKVLNFNRNCIRMCVRGERKHHNNFIWVSKK